MATVPEHHPAGPQTLVTTVEEDPLGERAGLHGQPVAQPCHGVEQVLTYPPALTVLCRLWNQEQAGALGLDVRRVVGVREETADVQRAQIDLPARARRRQARLDSGGSHDPGERTVARATPRWTPAAVRMASGVPSSAVSRTGPPRASPETTPRTRRAAPATMARSARLTAELADMSWPLDTAPAGYAQPGARLIENDLYIWSSKLRRRGDGAAAPRPRRRRAPRLRSATQRTV